MKTQNFATTEQIQNLRNVMSISHVEGKTATFYQVTFFNGEQKHYTVKH